MIRAAAFVAIAFLVDVSSFSHPNFLNGIEVRAGIHRREQHDVVVGWQKFEPYDRVPDTVLIVRDGSCSFAVRTVVVWRMDSGAHIYARAHRPGPDSAIWCWPDKVGGMIMMDASGADFTGVDADYSIDPMGGVT